MCTEQWMKQDLKMESRQLTNAQVLSDLEEANKLERVKKNFICHLLLCLNDSIESFYSLFLFTENETATVPQEDKVPVPEAD